MVTAEREVSVIIPFYNEEENVNDTLRAVSQSLAKSGFRSWELVLVNDGSTDSTRTLLEEWVTQDPNATVVNHRRNLGVGAALRSGIVHARGKTLVTIEGDLTYDPEDIMRLIDEINAGYDIVIGSHYARAGCVSGVPTLRYLISRIGNLLLARSIGLKEVSCVTNSFRAYRSNVRHLFATAHYEDKRLHPSILLLANLSKFRIKEIPVFLGPRKRGKSKTHVTRTAFSHAGLLFSIVCIRIRSAIAKETQASVFEASKHHALDNLR